VILTNPDLGSVGLQFTAVGVGTRILIFFALDPKIVPKLGNLRFGNSKTGKTG
jgi:hypothetical protein